MFKVIRECIEKPVYMMICDHRNCAMTMTGEIGDDPNAQREIQQAFIKSAVSQGWIIGLDAQLCPAHAAVLGKPQSKLVQVAGNVPGVGKLTGESAEEKVRRLHGDN